MRTTILLFLALLSAGLLAQSNTVAAGLEATGGAGRLSVSIGQVAPLYMATEEGGLNQGVQQPYPTVINTGVEGIEGTATIVFPNPSQGLLWVRRNDGSSLDYRLLGADGRLVRTGMLTPLEGSIDLYDLPSGTYLLYLTLDDRPVGTHRILKTH